MGSGEADRWHGNYAQAETRTKIEGRGVEVRSKKILNPEEKGKEERL